MSEQIARMEADARAAYAQMVFGIVEGGAFPPDEEVRKTALAAGFSIADAARHVALAGERHFWAVDQMEVVRAAGLERGELLRRQGELAADLNRLRAEYEKATRPLVAEHNRLADEARRLETQQHAIHSERPNELRRTLPPGWKAEGETLRRQREAVAQPLADLLKRRGDLQTAAKEAKRVCSRLKSAETPQDKAKLEAAIREHDRVEAELAAVDREYKRVQAEVARLTQAIVNHNRSMYDWKTCAFYTTAEETARRVREEEFEEARRGGGFRSGVTPIIVGGR